MKKLFLLCAVALMGFVNAQEAAPAAGFQGAWWGMGVLNYSNNDLTDESSFMIMPIAGTFVSPTVTVGAGVGYTTYDSGVDGADSVDSFIIQPLVRKYWGVAENLYIFGQAAVPMTFADEENSVGFQLSPGVDYFLSSHFTIEATIGAVGYTNVSPDEGDSVGSTNIGFDMTNLQFGLKYIF